MDQSNGYFTVSDLAKELDVKKGHIRFCEENGIISPRASKLKRRVYNRHDRERLKFVFHFVLLGYSKEQIIDLIGLPDSNLDENDQLTQGIEYGLKALKKLEKRKEELDFTKQTRIINEIEMLREYINKMKGIKSGVPEEPLERSYVRFEEKAKRPSKSVMAKTAEAEEKTTQHPVRLISLCVGGFALVILIGSYFYYQAGQKETKTKKMVQKKSIHSGKIFIPQPTEPADQITRTQAPIQEAEKLAQFSSDSQQNRLKEKLTNQQNNELRRLKSFLDQYCQAYTNKDMDNFITFFTSDATENNKPFHELLPDYRKNMESMESLTYRIELTSYSKQTASENLIIRGRFFTRYQLQKGIWEENNGSIFMELLENGDSFLIKQLNYSE